MTADMHPAPADLAPFAIGAPPAWALIVAVIHHLDRIQFAARSGVAAQLAGAGADPHGDIALSAYQAVDTTIGGVAEDLRALAVLLGWPNHMRDPGLGPNPTAREIFRIAGAVARCADDRETLAGLA